MCCFVYPELLGDDIPANERYTLSSGGTSPTRVRPGLVDGRCSSISISARRTLAQAYARLIGNHTVETQLAGGSVCWRKMWHRWTYAPQPRRTRAVLQQEVTYVMITAAVLVTLSLFSMACWVLRAAWQVHGSTGAPFLGAAPVRNAPYGTQAFRGQPDHRHQVHGGEATIHVRQQASIAEPSMYWQNPFLWRNRCFSSRARRSSSNVGVSARRALLSISI